MIIGVKDLKKGDKILLSCNGLFRFATVEKDPIPSRKFSSPGDIRYDYANISIIVNQHGAEVHTWDKTYSSQMFKKRTISLVGRDIWLVERDGQKI